MDWIPEPTWSGLWSALKRLAGGGAGLVAAYGAAIAVTVVSVARDRGDARQRWRVALLIACSLVPIVGSLGFSLGKPIFFSRYLVVCLPALAILGAAGLTTPRRAGVAAIALVGVVALHVPATRAGYSSTHKDDWRSATSLVIEHAGHEDGVIFFAPAGRRAFDYYTSLYGETPDAEPVYPTTPWDVVGADGFQAYRPQDTDLRPLIERGLSHERLWLVVSQGPEWRRELRAALPSGCKIGPVTSFTGVRVLTLSRGSCG